MPRKPLAVLRPEWVDWWWIVAYLMPLPIDRLKDIVQIRVDEKFQIFVNDLVKTAMAGKEMPAEVATAVYNLVDDIQAGRPMTIRTGDYIALRNYQRARG